MFRKGEHGSTIVTNQPPVETWYVILDRLVHNAYRFGRDGPSPGRSSLPIEDIDEGPRA